MKTQVFISIPTLKPQYEPMSVSQQLLGASLVSAGNDALRYLEALKTGDLDRLRRMLETSVDIGQSWAVRLMAGKKT